MLFFAYITRKMVKKMTIEEKLKQLIIAEYGSLRQFTIQKDLAYTNVDSMLRRGIKNATWTSVKNLCKALGISANSLADEKIVPVSDPEDTTKNLETMVLMARQNIQQFNDLTINDQLLQENEIEVLMDALEIGIEIVKRNRRRMLNNGKDN